MSDKDVFYKKFVGIVTKLGGWDESASIAGRSAAQMKRYARGDDPPLSVVRKICEAADFSVAWLTSDEIDFKGVPAKYADNGHVYVTKKPNIPLLNIAASVAHGKDLVYDETQMELVSFSQEWLHQQRLSPNELFMMPTIGDSMEPTIHSGDLLLCSESEHHKKAGDGVYVVRLDGNILVKRTQVLPGKKIIVTSDNAKQFQPYEIEMNGGVDFAVIGKVVFVLKKI